MMRPEAWFMGRRDCNTLGLSCRSAWQYATLSLSIAF